LKVLLNVKTLKQNRKKSQERSSIYVLRRNNRIRMLHMKKTKKNVYKRIEQMIDGTAIIQKKKSRIKLVLINGERNFVF
jgi:hypothetical protein